MHRLESNRRHLRALYEGEGPGLALIYEPVGGPRGGALGDYALGTRPVADWVPWYAAEYERHVRLSEEMGDDAVPYANLCTNTGIFAAAFGCRLHLFDNNNAAARPAISAPEEVARLTRASLDSPTLERALALAAELSRKLGPEVPISVPDIQSPLGIAAQVWDKNEFLPCMISDPGAVEELVLRCEELLVSFLREFRRIVPSVNMCHCPHTWIPADLGCALSEDEIGIISAELFERFGLPSLVRLSNEFGGLWMHCCADADHQYRSFAKIPRLRGLNRRFFRGPEACLRAFSNRVVYSMGWTPEEMMTRMIDAADPGSRFLFNLSGFPTPSDARPLMDRLRAKFSAKFPNP